MGTGSSKQEIFAFPEESDPREEAIPGGEKNSSVEDGRFMALCFDYKKDERISQYLTPIEGEEGFFKADNGDVYEHDGNVNVYRMVVSYALPPELDKVVNELMADKSRHLPHRDAAIESAKLILAQRKTEGSKKRRAGDRYDSQEDNLR
jgi:hypothetical protein